MRDFSLMVSNFLNFLGLNLFLALVELEDFWHNFSEDFVYVMRKNQYSESLAQFQNMFHVLVTIVLKRMQMTSEQLEYIEKMDAKRTEYDNDQDDGKNNEDSYENDLRELDEKQR